LLLWGVALAVYAVRTTGVEPLLIGVTAVTAGLVTMSTDNLVVLYLSLELQALSLYTLVGFYRFEEERTEAALRYLLTGSLVSGFMLLGFASGYTEHLSFYLHEYTSHPGATWIIGVLLFKLGVAPFHFWTPIVYTPLEWGTLALVLGVSKVNSWYLLVGLFRPCLGPTWWSLWWAAWLSVAVGAVGGYFQNNVAGVLAYSGVINGGYLLLLTVGGDYFGFGYYLVTYLWGTTLLVAAAAVWPVTQLSGLAHWSKLGILTPLLLYYLTINLGGLPVFPGFFAKLILLRGILEFGWLTVGTVVAASLLPAVYYVALAGTALFEPGENTTVVTTNWSPAVTAAVTVVTAAGFNAAVSVV